ncbi:MAG TPA: GDSL-type esterase/lipase family protein [Pyrinomonadaceae bacterium]|nr:GDSL-type esterase/lipase family protein [Pyrinomonadaceae bacterium]
MRRAILIFLLFLLTPSLAAAQEPITVYLAGDSTMARKLPEKRPETGWGEELQQFFDEAKVRIDNHAQNGRSTRTFIEEKRWQAIVDKLKPGDYVFIQFGHNDESPEKVDRYTPPADYRHNLINFVNDVRAKKATPVLLTPVMRRRFDKEGNFQDSHGKYPDLVRAVAAENKVAIIDMHRKSEAVIRQYGVEASKKLFLQLKPDENPNYPKGIEDNTHFSPLGAGIMASLATDGIREQKLRLARYLNINTWKIDDLKEIAGSSPIVTGKPQVIKDSTGKAISFDGKGDGLLMNKNPIAGARAFTIEGIFRPEAGGDFEQRWLHVQEDGTENRALLEIRVTGSEWFLDTFINSGSNKLTLYSEKFKHQVGRFYHVALVFDGVMMRDYVDGQAEMSGPLIVSPLGPGKTSLGVRMNHVSWFKGAIREVRFTQRALTPAEFMKK